MTSDWFNVPEKGGDVSSPDLKGYEVDGYSGNTISEQSPRWFVRVYADQSTLDALATESGVSRLGSPPTKKFNEKFGVEKTDEEYNESFKVS